MNERALADMARTLVGSGKGLLAMDESNPTCNKRFAAAGIPQSEEARRAYREMLITTPQLGDCISGAILYDETIRQSDAGGTRLVERLQAAGIVPGIKVDLGAKDFALHPGEKVTEGLDGLRGRLERYVSMGARFAKWRAVIDLGDDRPSRACLRANAHALARYAAICQDLDVVPIVEPEVLMAGSHTMQQCDEATERALQHVFEELRSQDVLLEGLVLKPNMVLSGLAHPRQADVAEVAEATRTCLLRNVPAAVAGIAFLSGGQSSELASARLNATNLKLHPPARCPWPLVFSFARALQQPALEIWGGDPGNVAGAQQALYHRASCNRAALHGEYDASLESEPAVL